MKAQRRRARLCVYTAILLVHAGAGSGRAQTASEVREARELMSAAGAAYRAAELADAAALFEQALALRPGHPVLLYSLAAARVRLGETAAGLALLDRAARLGLAADAANEPAFAELGSDSAFAAVVRRFKANGAPRGDAETAFSIGDTRFLAEGITHDPVTRRFFVGSVHRGIIVAVDSAGGVVPFAEPAAQARLGVMGMQVDAERRRLWVAAAAVPEVEGFSEAHEGASEVRRYHVDSGRLEQVYRAAPGAPHTFGDLAVDRTTGAVYVSDARSGALYTVGADAATLDVLVPPGSIDSPQGIVVAEDGGSLLVADYSTGIVRVDLATRTCVPLTSPADLSTIGIDGLAAHGATLIAVQNYPRPHRVLRLHLDDRGTAIVRADILLSADPRFDEPTLGTVLGDAFYFVANSQWPKFAPGRQDPTTGPIVLRLPLRGRAAAGSD